jgi:hypothetical protein
MGSTVLRSDRIAGTAQAACDAPQQIIKLPKTERELPQWETAIEVLMLVGDHAVPMIPHIAMMKALHRHKPKAAPEPRRKRAKVYKVIRGS